MSGPSIDDEDLKGVIPRMNEQIFAEIRKSSEDIEFLVKASYIQIYMEKIGDLLDRTFLRFPHFHFLIFFHNSKKEQFARARRSTKRALS